jgi:hypothetical protein
MPFSEMWCSVALLRLDVQEERCKVIQLVVTTNIVSSSLILFTLMMVAMRSSETSVLKIAARRHIPVDGILLSHGRENLNSYIALTGWTL